MTSGASKITDPSGLTIREVRGSKTTPAYGLSGVEYMRENFMRTPWVISNTRSSFMAAPSHARLPIVPHQAAYHKILWFSVKSLWVPCGYERKDVDRLPDALAGGWGACGEP